MILFLLFVAAVWVSYLYGQWHARNYRECPREIYGYDCKGGKCDHSDTAYYDAKLQEALNNDRPFGPGGY